MPKTKLFLFLFFLVLSSCADFNYQMRHNIQFKTIVDGVTDPTFNFANARRIGFFSNYWTAFGKANDLNALMEKQIFFYAKKELEQRGYLADYIEQERLQELPTGGVQCKDCSYDLILTLFYFQKKEGVNFAGGSSGNLGWNQYGGGGSYSSTGAYSVPYYNLFIKLNLYHGNAQEVWFGSIVQGTSEPTLTEKAEGLVKQIFSEKFPGR